MFIFGGTWRTVIQCLDEKELEAVNVLAALRSTGMLQSQNRLLDGEGTLVVEGPQDTNDAPHTWIYSNYNKRLSNYNKSHL